MAHRRSNIICGHKNSTQHQTARQQLYYRRHINFRINQIHDTGKNKYCTQDSNRNMPCNNFLPYKELNYQCYDRFSPCNVINRFLTVPFLQDFTIEIMTSSIRGTSNFLYSFVSSQKTTRYIFSIIMS